MELIKFDAKRCSLCGKCVEKCPFGALSFEDNGIVVGTLAECVECVSDNVQKKKQSVLSRKQDHLIKTNGKIFLIFVEQERGDIHPVAFELIGEARKDGFESKF